MLDKPPSGGDVSFQFIKAEANLLRLPLFALSTKGLRSLDGIECRGTTTRGGQTHEYIFRATRNTATFYPGLLSRAAHQSVLSLVAERGLPVANPVGWEWRDLCRRIGIVCSGRTVLELKAAFAATRGLLIDSQHAIYSKPDGTLLSTTQRHLSLYSDLAFVNSRLPSGGVADRNYVWLADWYLGNLNALFTAPLDYDLWRWLDRRSPIASRLYEFFLLNFFSGTPVLRINYPTLAQYLPVRAERYLSDAKRQLEVPFQLVALQDIIKKAAWAKTKAGVFQLLFQPGRRLADAGRDPQAPSFLQADFAADIEVRELRNLRPMEWTLVCEFYRLWSKDSNHRPTSKELVQARHLFDQFGVTKAKALIPTVVKVMEKNWPGAKTFGAVQRYLGDASAVYDQNQRALAQGRQAKARQRQRRDQESRSSSREAHFRATWHPVWERLREEEREQIRDEVVGDNAVLRRRRDSAIVLALCLKELARRDRRTTTAKPDQRS